jgi:hypothetical protein
MALSIRQGISLEHYPTAGLLEPDRGAGDIELVEAAAVYPNRELQQRPNRSLLRLAFAEFLNSCR